jgi:heptosyltransferase I
MASSVLVVRLGALGDLVHALPAVAAMRRAWPDARIDWLVDARYRALLAFVPIIDRTIVVGGEGGGSVPAVLGALRREGYDVAVDLQGLIKSAAMARLSGARRVVGFAAPLLRERAAALFYNVRVAADDSGHVIRKNLSVAAALGADADRVELPLRVPESACVAELRQTLGLAGDGAYAMINPGAGWPNKQWPAGRFGALAAHLRDRHHLRSIVTWGPAERGLAESVVQASSGAAALAPATTIGDLLALARAASLCVAGDTGPAQIAAAVGTPVVGIFGPTNPARNGPWAGEDTSVSRFHACECHHKRRCRRPTACIDTIGLDEIVAAVDRRLSIGRPRG